MTRDEIERRVSECDRLLRTISDYLIAADADGERGGDNCTMLGMLFSCAAILKMLRTALLSTSTSAEES